VNFYKSLNYNFMEKANKKKETPEINEELMMNLMASGVQKEGLEIPMDSGNPQNRKPERANPNPIKGRTRSKRTNDGDYERIFFKKAETNARDGKTVYIRPDFHEKLSRIVQVIGKDKITIYAYLDNLLDHHFKDFGPQITTSFNNNYKPIL